jgi:peptide/nickel transport system permease protein
LKSFWILFKGDWRFSIGGSTLFCLLIIAIFAPWIAPHSPTDTNLRIRLQAPSIEHPLGTDKFGRDVASRLIYGTQVSLTVGLVVVAVSATVGFVVGAIAGFFGGWVDALIMRLVDVMLAFPGFLLALALVATMGSTLQTVIVAISVAYSPRNALVMRSVILTVRQNAYVEAAYAVGASNFRILSRHVFPNAIPPLIVIASINAAIAITAEAGLSYLGLGVQPPTATWGAVISDGRDFVRTNPWICISAGFAIMTAVMSLNLLGDSLRDVLDPRMRGSLRNL